VVADGGYANREFLKPAKAAGFVAVARLRRDAQLFDLPPVLQPGQRRGPGRPPTYGKNRLSLAKRAGQPRGWQSVEVVTTTGQVVTKKVKSFLATWHPAGGLVRAVIVKQSDGSWRAYPCTDPEASVEEVVQATLDRWSIEQDFHDLKEVEGLGQQQLRDIWANVGAFHVSAWVHTLIELWAWGLPREAVCDRSASPWDDPNRRPSHADRRKALQRSCLGQEFRQLTAGQALTEEIRQFVGRVIQHAA
jgi:hypothetical protein